MLLGPRGDNLDKGLLRCRHIRFIGVKECLSRDETFDRIGEFRQFIGEPLDGIVVDQGCRVAYSHEVAANGSFGFVVHV
ncbi:hypothetical protein [Euzebya pacifica]|uniref:hypothetical protein n=1 Tax=Euzebya pacifica TaxID=1608957 RepID=UPI0013E0811C|nr:hypothetical protein [Euzebya pacifica]